jgi:hypothetical protein
MTYFYGKDIEFHKKEEKVVRILSSLFFLMKSERYRLSPLNL